MNFIQIPEIVYRNKELSHLDKLLFGQILSLTAQEGYCWATNSFLCKANDITERTLQKGLKRLSDNFLINIVLNNFGENKCRRQIYVSPTIKNAMEASSLCRGSPVKNDYHNIEGNIEDNTNKEIFDYNWLEDSENE